MGAIIFTVLTFAPSQWPIAGDADGSRKGLSDGANHTSDEGKVSVITLRLQSIYHRGVFLFVCGGAWGASD
jgi:hypothetical protein